MKSLEPLAPGSAPELTEAEAVIDSAPAKDELRERLAALGKRLDALQTMLYADGKRGVVAVLQARDAGGKDGTIRNVFGLVNPQGLAIRSFGVPSAQELSHDYLWRVHNAVGPRGSISVFNRSHYEDVLVVRVHELVPEQVWKQRYDQINAFERMLTENGYAVLKFFLHVSKDEQKRRLEKRLDNPEKNWKFKAGDLGERKRWDDYTAAYRDALAHCSTKDAPWFVVPADVKRVRDVLIADTLVRTLEGMKLAFPPADPEALAWRGRIA